MKNLRRVIVLFAVALMLSIAFVAHRSTRQTPTLLPLQIRILTAQRTTVGDRQVISFSCRVKNPNNSPVMLTGYPPDNFNPPLEKGIIAPFLVVEALRDGKWEKHSIGWCGMGVGSFELVGNQETDTTEIAVLVEQSWEAVRVGIDWSPSLDFSQGKPGSFATAWSEPFALDSVAPSGSAHANEAGRITAQGLADRSDIIAIGTVTEVTNVMRDEAGKNVLHQQLIQVTLTSLLKGTTPWDTIWITSPALAKEGRQYKSGESGVWFIRGFEKDRFASLVDVKRGFANIPD
jgi:hypothetical protein